MKTYRIEIATAPQWHDARGAKTQAQIARFLKLPVTSVRTRDVYTVVADVTPAEAEKIRAFLTDPVLQKGRIGGAPLEGAPSDCRFVIQVGFKPGVTDNVARTAVEACGDVLGRKFTRDEHVFSSVEYLLSGPELTLEQAEKIGRGLLANVLIQTVHVYPAASLTAIPDNVPLVAAAQVPEVRRYNLEVSDAGLEEISRKGILALTLEEMKVIQNYFRNAKGRTEYGLDANPTDVELEVLAQTWSEHCKHKIFSAAVEYEDCETGEKRSIDSCYKSFIKKSTREIAEKIDWLVSVFSDNAGVIRFNDKCDLAYKVETHNSPSALDPYGGAMTGIVGVNRDPMGTGQGAELLINVWGYCLGSPFTDDKDVPEGLLHPRRLRDGVHQGVIDGGNQSGIPYGYGWEYFDERYLGKPLVYCGTVGVLPRTVAGRKGAEKEIKPGDLIVMGGGRIGKDGIHGATFSSEELHKDSPTQAVQIGDPITQKKLGDFTYEARNRGLYRFITDNGAGGLSSSVGEMAELCGGCRMDLAKAPLKYAGLAPWEILVSEAQERMSYAVPPEKIDEFLALAKARDVEVSVLGEFTNDGKFHVLYDGRTVALLDIDFMHNGLPKLHLNAKWKRPVWPEPPKTARNLADDVVKMLARLNVTSDEFKARQYDHEVKGLSVIKPFVGKCRDVVSDATVTMIEPLSTEGVILTAGILPRHGDVDTYAMMAGTIDLAVRRMIAVGGKLGHIAGLDNFCWPDPVKSEKTPDGEYKLAQLVRANQALYDFTKLYGVPCISGKDSMKNDSTRGGRKISIPPSVLFSTIAKMDDVRHAVTLDAKCPGDDVYVLGVTAEECGGSEYYAMLGFTGNQVPQVDATAALKLYDRVSQLTEKDLAHSLHTPAFGGLAVALAKVAIGGRLGLDVDLAKLPLKGAVSDAAKLFAESHARFVMTASPADREMIAAILGDVPFAIVGKVTAEPVLKIAGAGAAMALPVADLTKSYKSTLDRI